MRPISLIVIHGSATTPVMDIGAAEINEWHISRHPPFRKIGYHKVIRRDGVIEPGRDYAEIGAHVKGNNRNSIGICLVGGIDYDGQPENNYTLTQFCSLFGLLSDLRDQFPSAVIMGHRDVPGAKTSCPCFDVGAYITGANLS